MLTMKQRQKFKLMNDLKENKTFNKTETAKRLDNTKDVMLLDVRDYINDNFKKAEIVNYEFKATINLDLCSYDLQAYFPVCCLATFKENYFTEKKVFCFLDKKTSNSEFQEHF